MTKGPRSSHVTALVAGALGVTALSAGLTGCSLPGHHPHVETAIGFLPSDTTALVFTDREAVAKRLDLDDVSGRDATDDDVARYDKALADEGWGQTQLAPYLPVMSKAPFNELDIRWEITARWGDGSDARVADVWRADDEVDLGALGRDLTAKGYRKSTTDGLALYTIDFLHKADKDGLVGGVYPRQMADVLIDSDDHLVVGSQTTAALDEIARVAVDDDDSLADHPGHYDELVDKAGDAEFAAMADGDGICQEVTPYGGSGGSPDQQYADLGHPVARALVATGDPVATTNYLEFSSADAAGADADARKDLIESASELRTRQPFSGLGTFTVSHSGDLVKIDADWASGPRSAVSAELTGGGPAACLPQS